MYKRAKNSQFTFYFPTYTYYSTFGDWKFQFEILLVLSVLGYPELKKVFINNVSPVCMYVCTSADRTAYDSTREKL